MFSFSSTVSRILTWFTLQYLTKCNFGFSSRQLVRNWAHLRLQENVKSGLRLELEDVCELKVSLASTEHSIILCWNKNKKLELFLFDFRCHSRSLLKSNIKLIFKSDQADKVFIQHSNKRWKKFSHLFYIGRNKSFLSTLKSFKSLVKNITDNIKTFLRPPLRLVVTGPYLRSCPWADRS